MTTVPSSATVNLRRKEDKKTFNSEKIKKKVSHPPTATIHFHFVHFDTISDCQWQVTAFLRKLQKMIFIFPLVRLAPERKTFSVVAVAPVTLMLLLSLMKHCFAGKGEEVGGLRSWESKIGGKLAMDSEKEFSFFYWIKSRTSSSEFTNVLAQVLGTGYGRAKNQKPAF